MKCKMLVIFLLVVMLSIILTSCSDKSTNNNNNPNLGAANQLARQGMNMLNTEILRLQNTEPEPNQESMMPQMTYNSIKAKFTEAIELDSDNPMANLGLAVLDIVQINYDPELWNLYDDVSGLNPNKRFLNNQFSFLANSPTVLFKSFDMARSDPVSIMRFQNFVKNSIIPRLDAAKGRLGNAVALADSNTIMIDTGEESVEIDAGEIYAFKAQVELLMASFQMMVAYNWDMVDQQNGYTWITDMANMPGQDYEHDNAFEATVENNILTIKYWDDDFNDSDVKSQELAAKTLHYNIFEKPAFATLTDQTLLTQAKSNIQAAIQDVQDGIDHILVETDPQENDIIKIQNILDMNADIANHDPDQPAFMQEWDDVNDIANWLESILTSPYTTTINGQSVTINLSAYFNGNLDDLREVQPYSHWYDPATSWIKNSLSWDYHWYNVTQYTFMLNGQSTTFSSGFNSIHFMNYVKIVEVGYLTDADDNELSNNDYPYFPDYTFKGMFPGMTRAKMIALFGE